MKLIKKYLSGIFTALVIQSVFGINFANALPCESEILENIKQENSSYGGMVHFNYWTNRFSFTSPDDFWLQLKKTINSYYPDVYDKEIYRSRNASAKKDLADSKGLNWDVKLQICYTQAMVDANADIDAIINGKTGNKSSSSGSTSQANKKANRQATASQSSSSVDERVKKINDAVDQGNNAHDNKDYAKSISAIKYILANSSNITLKGEATNRLAEYYKDGHGVPKDEVKAQALFEQASVAGNSDANAHICQNYEEGTGGVTKNHQTAIKYCTEAANKGHLISMSKLGYLYHAGIGTINPELGNEWICKAAKQGNSTAIGNAQKLKLNCN